MVLPETEADLGIRATDKRMVSSKVFFYLAQQVFMTATHSHGSPFAPVEGVLCPILFGSVPSGHDDHHHDHHHGGSHEPPSSPSPLLPAKTRDELNEGTRKRKAKKAE